MERIGLSMTYYLLRSPYGNNTSFESPDLDILFSTENNLLLPLWSSSGYFLKMENKMHSLFPFSVVLDRCVLMGNYCLLSCVVVSSDTTLRDLWRLVNLVLSLFS